MKFSEFKESINNILLGAITVVFLAVIGYIAYKYPSTYKVPMWLMYLLLLVWYIVCVVLYAMFSNNTTKGKRKYPKVISIASSARLVLEESDLYYPYMAVSIFFNDMNTQEYVKIGLGYVVNIQDDKKIIICIVKENRDELSNLGIEISNDQNIVNKLIVKPYIVRDDYISLGGNQNE